MINYFAYGSNMDQKRMIDRGIIFHNVKSAKLYNYELKFNKVSIKQGAVANVEYKEGSIVEGMLYSVESLELLDKYEGAPKHYSRIILNIEGIDAYVYVANKEYIKEGLKPKQEYLNHLLEGKEYLSEEYFEKLKNILHD